MSLMLKGKCRRQVSILRPPRYDRITISNSDFLSHGARDGFLGALPLSYTGLVLNVRTA